MVNVNGVYHCKSPCSTITWGKCHVFSKHQTSKSTLAIDHYPSKKFPLKAFIGQLEILFWGSDITSTPLKINMEPGNIPLGRGNTSTQTPFCWIPC